MTSIYDKYRRDEQVRHLAKISRDPDAQYGPSRFGPAADPRKRGR